MKRSAKRKANETHEKKPVANSKSKSKAQEKKSSEISREDLFLIFASVALLVALIFCGFQVVSYIKDTSRREESIKIVNDLKQKLKDNHQQAQNVQIFDRMLKVLDNRLYHDSFVYAITNTSFMKFVANHMTEQAAVCTSPYSHDIVLKSLKFILEYGKRENEPACLVPEPVQVLFRCSMFSDIKPAVWNFVQETINMTGSSCEQEYLRAFLNLAMMSKKTKLYGEALEFAKERTDEVLMDNKLKVCNVVDMARANIEEWDETMKSSICDLSGRLDCNIFRTLDVNSWC